MYIILRWILQYSKNYQISAYIFKINQLMKGIMSSEADLIILGGDLNAMPNDAGGTKILSDTSITCIVIMKFSS